MRRGEELVVAARARCARTRPRRSPARRRAARRAPCRSPRAAQPGMRVIRVSPFGMRESGWRSGHGRSEGRPTTNSTTVITAKTPTMRPERRPRRERGASRASRPAPQRSWLPLVTQGAHGIGWQPLAESSPCRATPSCCAPAPTACSASPPSTWRPRSSTRSGPRARRAGHRRASGDRRRRLPASSTSREPIPDDGRSRCSPTCPASTRCSRSTTTGGSVPLPCTPRRVLDEDLVTIQRYAGQDERGLHPPPREPGAGGRRRHARALAGGRAAAAARPGVRARHHAQPGRAPRDRRVRDRDRPARRRRLRHVPHDLAAGQAAQAHRRASDAPQGPGRRPRTASTDHLRARRRTPTTHRVIDVVHDDSRRGPRPPQGSLGGPARGRPALRRAARLAPRPGALDRGPERLLAERPARCGATCCGRAAGWPWRGTVARCRGRGWWSWSTDAGFERRATPTTTASCTASTARSPGTCSSARRPPT